MGGDEFRVVPNRAARRKKMRDVKHQISKIKVQRNKQQKKKKEAAK